MTIPRKGKGDKKEKGLRFFQSFTVVEYGQQRELKVDTGAHNVWTDVQFWST